MPKRGVGSTATGTSRKAPAARGSGTKIVYDQLRREIIELELAPGSQLDETSISARFSMSRTPVREALVRLAAEGLVVTLPNRNTIVSPIKFETLPTYFDALTLMYRVTTRLGAQHRTQADLKTIRQFSSAFDEAVLAADAFEMIAANREFHLAISRAGRNTYYTEWFARLLDEGLRILRIYYQTFDDRLPKQYVQEHALIIAAVEAHDVELADRLATDHARQIVEQIQNFLTANTGAKIVLGGKAA